MGDPPPGVAGRNVPPPLILVPAKPVLLAILAKGHSGNSQKGRKRVGQATPQFLHTKHQGVVAERLLKLGVLLTLNRSVGNPSCKQFWASAGPVF